MDWAQHIKMDYAHNLTKTPIKAKKLTFRRFIEEPACSFSRSGIHRSDRTMKYIQFYENT